MTLKHVGSFQSQSYARHQGSAQTVRLIHLSQRQYRVEP